MSGRASRAAARSIDSSSFWVKRRPKRLTEAPPSVVGAKVSCVWRRMTDNGISQRGSAPGLWICGASGGTRNSMVELRAILRSERNRAFSTRRSTQLPMVK
jgi:hypothetical protein